MDPNIEHAAEDLWVFGYGSLIWRPGFDHLERVPARLIGAHRALCVFSHVHRGTPERPGLVLGLDLGGACRGIAYRVAAKKRAETVAYLRAREQVTSVYRETDALRDAAGGAAAARAGAGLHDRPRPRAVCRPARSCDAVHLVRQGHGQSGPNREYVLSTVHALEALGLYDRDLHLLAEKLKGAHGEKMD